MVTLHIAKYSHIAFFSLLLISLPSFCVSEKDELFHGTPVSVLESAYKNAPPKVHFIIDSLMNKNNLPRYNRNFMILDGESGVGKSTLALSIAYKLKWDAQRINANDFMKIANRNGSSVVFNDLMSEFEDNYDEKVVIILDDINYLLMNYDSKYHDTDSLSMSFWSFLDNIRHNSNLFFIGTTNGIGGFPPQIISRFKSCIVKITASQDLNVLKDNFFDLLSQENITLSVKALQYIHDNVSRLEGYNICDLKHLVNELKIKYVELSPELYQKNELCIIEPEHISAALKELADLEMRFAVKPYKEVDYEQRERHHREILEQNAQFYNTLLAKIR